MNTAVWRRCAVRIVVGPEEKPGEMTVAGWECDDARGLAVSRSVSDERIIGGWSVTHVASGRVIADGLSMKNVRKVAIAIAPLADWSTPVPRPKQAAELLQLAVFAIGESRRRNPRHLVGL